MSTNQKTSWLAGLLMLTMSALVYAQSPLIPKGPAAPAASATSTSDTPVVVTAEMRAAIKELLEVSKFKDSLRLTYQSLGQNLPAQMAQIMSANILQNPKLSEEQKVQVREHLNKSFEGTAKAGIAVLQDPKLIDEVTEKVYSIYAKYYTVAEIKQLSAFYKTPAGVKSLTTMPQIINETMRTTMVILQPRITPIIDGALKKEIEAVQQGK